MRRREGGKRQMRETNWDGAALHSAEREREEGEFQE